uniref:Chaperonin-like RbcX protein n=1 Tax=Araucaria cunninghamii TaxID=56994 RepID=A0A0D6R2H0_ARACU
MVLTSPSRMVGAVSVLGTIGDHVHVHEPLASRSSVNVINTEAKYGKRQHLKSRVHTSSSSWEEWRMSAKVFRGLVDTRSIRQRTGHSLVVVDEIAGQYEDSFQDVGKHLLNYFTFKAVRTVLTQLYEMNPTQYTWFYNFVATNKPNDGKQFLRHLVKERQELGERVMVTRLHLFNKWVKKYNHLDMHKAITDENLELMRERLVETVRWPSDIDGDAGKNG